MPITPLDFFIRASDALVKFNANFNTLRDEDLDIYCLEVRSSELKTLWVKAKSTFDECLGYLQTAEAATKADIDSADGKYDVAYEAYMQCLSAINRKLDQIRGTRASSRRTSSVNSVRLESEHSAQSSRGIRQCVPASQGAVPVIGESDKSNVLPENSIAVPTSNPTMSDSVHNLSLPPCDTDVFQGDFLSWPTFRDLFSAVYIHNSRLSDVERLCHLVRKTSGEAREIVSKFPLTHRSFVLAWKALRDAYDNTRILVHNQLKGLFSLPILDGETSSGLKSVQRGINGCLSAMTIYNVPTDNWDPILVFVCGNRV